MRSGLGARRAREPDPESGAAIQFAVHPDKTVTLADDAVDRGRAKARAFTLRFSGQEWVENLEELFGGNAPLQSRSLRAGRIL